MIWAVLLLTTSINLYKFGKLVPWIETVAGCLHVSMFVVFSIVLLALGPKHNADFVFFSRVDSALTSGWTNDFVGWNLGLQTSVWCFVGKWASPGGLPSSTLNKYQDLILQSILQRRYGNQPEPCHP